MLPRIALPLALALVAGPLAAQWNTGVGGDDARTSSSVESGPGSRAILWQGSLPAIVAQQAVIDGDVVVTNRIGSFTIPSGTWIVAHDIDTGALLWQAQLPASFPDSWRSRAEALRDGRVYASRSGNANAEYLYALDVANGNQLWRSTDLVFEGSTESVAFAPDGDPIVNGKDASGASVLLRIESTDGSTVWATPRSCPTTGGCDAAVANGKAYAWEPSPAGPVITAFDLVSGAKLYSSAAVGAGFIQQVAPFVGPDGTVYAPRSVNNPTLDFLTALTDTGSGFATKWAYPIGYVPFASHAVGPDGSVYALSRSYELARLDPASGAVVDLSEPIPNDFPMQVRMAVDGLGKVFLTNGSFGSGELFAFTPDLRTIWRDPITNVNVGGPALGRDGTLVVCGVGTDLRVYRDPCDGYFVQYGDPCAGSGGFAPALVGSGCPSAGNTITVDVVDGLGGAPAFLGLGLGPGTSTLVPGCELAIAPVVGTPLPLVLPGAAPGAGDLTLPFPVPPGLAGLDVFLQVLVADSGGSAGIALTNALQIHFE